MERRTGPGSARAEPGGVGADQAAPAVWRDYIGSSAPSAKAHDFLPPEECPLSLPGGHSPGDFKENAPGGGRGQGTGGGWPMDWARPSRSFRPVEPAGPLRLDHSARIPVACRPCRLRLRSQVAKAADCKSAIVGSTPTGASLALTPAKFRNCRVSQGFLRFWGRLLRRADNPQSCPRVPLRAPSGRGSISPTPSTAPATSSRLARA